MKFTTPLALFAAAVSAQSTLSSSSGSNCDAEPIVEACFSSESAKLDECSESEYDCKCRAAEAVATCFNNCPDDSRAGTYQDQVRIHCGNASIHGTAAKASESSAVSATASDAEASATGSSDDDDDDDDDDALVSDFEQADETGAELGDSGVGQLTRDAEGLLLAVAGVIAAVL